MSPLIILLYALYRQAFHPLGSRILTCSSRKTSGSSISQHGCVLSHQHLKLPMGMQGSSRQLEGKRSFKTTCCFVKWKHDILFSGKLNNILFKISKLLSRQYFQASPGQCIRMLVIFEVIRKHVCPNLTHLKCLSTGVYIYRCAIFIWFYFYFQTGEISKGKDLHEVFELKCYLFSQLEMTPGFSKKILSC